MPDPEMGFLMKKKYKNQKKFTIICEKKKVDSHFSEAFS
jgi:hypothetical protein